MSRLTVWIVLFVGILSLFQVGGCVSRSDIQLLQSQINSLKDQQIRWQRENLYRMKNLRKDFEKSLSNSTFSVRSTQADIASELDNLRLQVASLKGEEGLLKIRLEASENATAQLSKQIVQIEKALKGLQRDVKELKDLLGVTSPVKSKTSSSKNAEKISGIKKGESSSVSSGKGLEISPNKIYKRAISNFEKKNYYIAIHLLGLFLEKFPHHPLVPNAYFWRGECYYQLKQYPQAILNYQRVIDNFPTSNKYPAALLKEGMAFYLINKRRAGKILLKELITNFPSSREARRAKTFLKEHR